MTKDMDGEKQVFAPRGTRPHGAAVEGPYAEQPKSSAGDKAVGLLVILLWLLVMFGAFTPVAHGAEEDWVLITTSVDDDRWLLNAKTVSIQKSNGTWAARAVVAQINSSDGREYRYGVAVSMRSCVNEEGAMAMYNPRTKRKEGKWWSANGTKVYDGLGKWLCEAAKIKIREMAQ